jgi:hypothetical protein
MKQQQAQLQIDLMAGLQRIRESNPDRINQV